MFKSISTIALASIVAIAFTSCESSPYEGYDKAESGLYYKFYNKSENGAKPKEGDIVTVNMVYKNDKDSVIFSSEKANIQAGRQGVITLQFPCSKPAFAGCFEDGLMMMGEGDSASFKISADSIYYKTFNAKELPPYVTKGTMLTFDVKLEKIKSKEEAMKEQQEMQKKQQEEMMQRKEMEAGDIAKFVADNKITVKPTENGLYYIEIAKGKGPKVMAGDTIVVKYTGMFLDKKVFDTSDRSPVPVKFAIGVGQVIPGWDEGLVMMNKGGKAQLIIPSSIGYGEMGAQGTIPPFTPLLFAVEVVDVIAVKK